MALEQMFVLTLHSNMGQRNAINVFTYQLDQAINDPADAIEPLFNAFESVHFGAGGGNLNGTAFHTSISWTSLEAYNLFDLAAFGERLITEAGAHATSEAMPIANAYGFRSARKTREIRRGFKRFAGVPEDAGLGASGQIAAGFLTELELLAGALGATMFDTGPSGFTFSPVVIKRVPYVAPSGKDAYRFPETEAELSFFVADEWEANTLLTTQVGRKKV